MKGRSPLHTEIIYQYLSQLRVSLITANYATTSRSWKAKPFHLTFNKFYYIESGEGQITINNSTYFPKKGSLMFIPEGCEHAYATLNQQPYTKYWCHFTAYIGSNPLSSVLSFPYHLENVPNEKRLTSIFKRLLQAYQSRDVRSPLLVQSTLLELIYFYFQSIQPDKLQPRNLESTTDLSVLVQYIDLHLNRKLTLQDLAEVVNLHPNYLVPLFKAQFGFTPMNYLNLQRIHRAKELLNIRELSISYIAREVGFDTPYYFTQVFKKHTGLTPTEYRKLTSRKTSKP